MIRLHIIGEGPTEKRFVEGLLVDHLISNDIITDVCCFLTKFVRKTGEQFKGGISNYDKIKSDINRRLREDNKRESRFTTMIDLYGIPKDFPGYNDARKVVSPYEKVKALEIALEKDINDHRFIPYIQLHEFEALIFADPKMLEYEYLDHEKEISQLVHLSQQKEPELINDGVDTSPSHRIYNLIKSYNKPYAGGEITRIIGLNSIRQRCPHFNEWITKLEGLNT